MKKGVELKQVAERIQSIAVDLGADAAHVGVVARRANQIKLEKNDYHLNRSDDTVDLSIEVHKNFRRGSAITNDLSDASLKDTAERALMMASVGVPDEKLAFSKPGKYVDLPLFDERVAALTPENLSSLAKVIFDPSLSDPEFSLDGGEMMSEAVSEAIVNTNGVSISRDSSKMMTYLMGIAKRGDEVTSFDVDWHDSRNQDNFAECAIANYEHLRNELKSNLNPRKIDSYSGLIILRHEVVAEMLLQVIFSHAHGNLLKDNASKWADKLGKKVASELFTIADDPHNLDFMGATSFDGMGTAVEPGVLIDKGELKFFMESVDSASRRGTNPTGHESGLNVVRMAGGSGTIFDLAKQAGKPVVAVKGFSGNINNITGDFSGIAKKSHMIENGERYPVTEIMIAGNIFDMIENIVAVGASINWRGSMEAPPYLIDGVSVSSGTE